MKHFEIEMLENLKQKYFYVHHNTSADMPVKCTVNETKVMSFNQLMGAANRNRKIKEKRVEVITKKKHKKMVFGEL